MYHSLRKAVGGAQNQRFNFQTLWKFLSFNRQKNEFDFEVTYGSKQTHYNRSCRRSDDDSVPIKRTLTIFSFLSLNENSL